MKLMDHVKLNDFLNGVIPNVELISVNPIIPSMNDIFIKVVEETEKEKADLIQGPDSDENKEVEEGGENE